jgi:hypothetical protein
MSLPGMRLLAIARLWFDKATIDRVFEPLVADWQAEYASAPAAERRRIWFRGLTALFTTSIVVIGRSTRGEASRPPAAIETAKLVGAALGTCTAFALLVRAFDAGPTLTALHMAGVAQMGWANMIWSPKEPARERPLATYLKLSAGLLLVVAIVDGPAHALVAASFVPVFASLRLPGADAPRDVARRGFLVFGPIAAALALSGAANLTWSAWLIALLGCWALWSVVACSLDATRTTNDGSRASPDSRRL